jgi:putative endonuclease
MNSVFQPAVYLLASQPNGTLYIGVTANLVQRVFQHREGLIEGFTKQYAVKLLVWYELHATMEFAIAKEKAMKEWKREWKINRIREMNSSWCDLYPSIL